MYSMSILFSNFQMISYYWNRRLLDLIPIRYQFSFNQYYDTTQTKQQCQKRNKSFPSFSIHHSTAHHKSVIKNWLQPHRALSIYLHSSAHYLTNRMDSGKKIRTEWVLTTFIEANVWGNVECDFRHHRKLSWMCYAKKKDEVTRSWLLAFVCWTNTNLYWCK